MRVKHRPGWYALRAGMASVLALGTAGLVAASSAAASPAASGGPHCNASVTRDNFGTANSGPYGGNQTVWRYTITNRHCMQVRIMTYGATVQSIKVPDRQGHIKNVALGFKTLKEYVQPGQPAADIAELRRPVLRGDHRPVRQPDRGRLVQAQRDDVHTAGQQRAEHAARRVRRLG